MLCDKIEAAEKIIGDDRAAALPRSVLGSCFFLSTSTAGQTCVDELLPARSPLLRCRDADRATNEISLTDSPRCDQFLESKRIGVFVIVDEAEDLSSGRSCFVETAVSGNRDPRPWLHNVVE